MKFSIFATPFIIGLALISPAMGCSSAPSINAQIFDLLNRIFRPVFKVTEFLIGLQLQKHFLIGQSKIDNLVRIVQVGETYAFSWVPFWKRIKASLLKSLFNLKHHEQPLPLPPLLQLPLQLVLHLHVKFKEINSLLLTQITDIFQFACLVMVLTG